MIFYLLWKMELLDDGEHVPLVENDVLIAVKLHFGAAYYCSEDDPVADFHSRKLLAVLENLPVPIGDDFALGWAFPWRCREERCRPWSFPHG